MCRFVCYLGPPVTLAAVVLEPPHCLHRQSFAPRHQRVGAVNADGFGVGWYDHDRRPEPARYRVARPIWADRSFASLAGLVTSTAVVAALRDATPPSPVDESGCPPFTAGPWLFAHNGKVDGFGSDLRVKVALRAMASAARGAGIEGSSDSEVLFALALDRLDHGDGAPDALAAVVGSARSVATATLNLLLTDGHHVAATACGDSLFVLESDDSVVVASEPFDDDRRWQRVADGSLVEARPGHLAIKPLDG